MTRHKEQNSSLKQVFASSGNSRVFVITGTDIRRAEEIINQIVKKTVPFDVGISHGLDSLKLVKPVTTDVTLSTEMYDVVPQKEFLSQREHRTFALQWGNKNSKLTGIPTKGIDSIFEKGHHCIIPLGLEHVTDFQWFSENQIHVISITKPDERINHGQSSGWCHITDSPGADIAGYVAMICSEQITRQ